jgi:threonine aldolase
MREILAQALVGDDVFGEDPSVNHLETSMADVFGKEAALFVPSGTMANLVALLAHCPRSTQVIAGQDSHVICYEQGGMASLGGIFPAILPNLEDGSLDPEAIDAILRVDNLHVPYTSLICLESTHNRCGGSIPSAQAIQHIFDLAKKHQVPMHLDGARLWHAAIATQQSLKDLTQDFASVSVCFSKGLGAPCGSLLLGSKIFIDSARRIRKSLGGGLRQAGILAAACHYAFEHHFANLVEDHVKAKALHSSLRNLGELIRCKEPQTNIVNIDLVEKRLDTHTIIAQCQQAGLLLFATGPKRLRAVCHRDISMEQMERAGELLCKVLVN